MIFSIQNIISILLGYHIICNHLQIMQCNGDMIQHYNSSMILYSRAIQQNTVTLSEESKQIVQNAVNQLDKLGSPGKIDEGDVRSENMNSLEKRMEEDLETRYSEFVKIAINILETYQTAILSKQDELTYAQKVFYYRALRWLKYRIELHERNENMQLKYQSLEGKIAEFLSAGVAEDDTKITSPDDISQKFGTQSQPITLQQFELFRYHEDAVAHLAFERRTEIRAMEPEKYESILTEKPSEDIFKTEFGLEPFRMLMYMDYGYSQTNSYVLKDIKAININTVNEAFEGWKYALIFFSRSIDTQFQPPYSNHESNNDLEAYYLILENITLLEHFLVRKTAPSLRQQCYTFFNSMILPRFDDFIRKMDYHDYEIMMKRLYYARLLSWLKYRLSKAQPPKQAGETISEPEIIIKTEENKSIPVSVYVEERINREKEENPIIKLLSLDITENIEKVEKINDLTKLCHNEEQVLRLFDVLGRECECEIVKNYHSMLQHQVYQPKGTKVEEIPKAKTNDIKPHLYEDMLQRAKPEDFKKKFNLEPHEMLLYMDYAYNFGLAQVLHNVEKGQYETLKKQGQAENGDQGLLMCWKRELNKFYRNYEKLSLNGGKMNSKFIKLLEHFSDTDNPLPLKSLAMAFLYVHILREIEEKIEKHRDISVFANSVFTVKLRFLKYAKPPGKTIKSTIIDILQKIRAEQKPISDETLNKFIKQTQSTILHSKIETLIEEDSSFSLLTLIKEIPSKLKKLCFGWK